MAQTTLSVRLLQRSSLTMTQSVAFRSLHFVIMLFTCTILVGCGSEEGGGIRLNANTGEGGSSTPSASAVAAASLAWDPVSEVVGYYVHYGTESPNSAGSCAYAHSVFSSTPAATVAGLEANTTYYFAVSSFNGVESACSSEVSTVTTSA